MTIDNPHIRQITTCPVCGGFKDKGLVTCWSCYRSHNLKYGNPRCETIIAEYERDLIAAGR